MKKATKLIAALLITSLLTGCSGSGNADATKDALLATETTAATETTKATTPKPTTKPATKSSTTKTTKPTGKTDSTKATEATKPAASEPAATQKPAESQKPAEMPKPTNPPATEAPKPTNPPATNPPATEAPKPTNPPETEPPETDPPVVSLSCDDAIAHGRQYIASLGAILDTGLAYDDPGYYPAGFVMASTQDELNWEVVAAIDNDLAVLKSRLERSGYDYNVADVRLDVYVEWDSDYEGYYITVYYG